MKDWKETERGLRDIRKACYGRISHDTSIRCCSDAVKMAQLWIITFTVGIHREQPLAHAEKLFIWSNCIFTYLSTGFLWQVRPFPGVLQADRNWMAARSQDRGTDNSYHANLHHLVWGYLDSDSDLDRHGQVKPSAQCVLMFCLRCYAGGEKQPEPSMETVSNPVAGALWRWRGEIYKGTHTHVHIDCRTLWLMIRQPFCAASVLPCLYEWLLSRDSVMIL